MQGAKLVELASSYVESVYY
uniref:Uncharacterized protein n=1 Tax=Anguilla anguilla TaxID=7936 RepID=A0A0E9TH07_ANGAN